MPDIVTSKTFVDGEKGITAAKMNQIISGAVIQPAFYSAKPSSATLDPTDVLLELKGTGAYAQITGAQLASSVAGQLPLADATQNGMLRQVSGNTTDVVDGTNHCVPIASMPGITQMRLRSFNALGNPTFEVDQRNVGAALINPVTTTFIQDRWQVAKALGGAGTVNTALQTGLVTIPGTNFAISNSFQRFTVGTAQATLAAGDRFELQQFVEGPQWRELSSDVHSISVLVRSSIGLAFAVGLSNLARTSSLRMLCTIPTPNVWTLITLPNLPLWSGSGFAATPGQTAYLFEICLASGTTFIPPANNTWQAGDFRGAVGMSNFLATAGATFDIAYAGHEPGAICTTPIDCPFGENYDGRMGCLRYYSKSYPYSIAVGTATYAGTATFFTPGTTAANATVVWPKIMAKTPTVTIYSPGTGAANTVVNASTGAATAITGTANVSPSGLMQLTGTAFTTATQYFAQWIADTSM